MTLIGRNLQPSSMDRAARTLAIIRQMVSEGDIERMYGEDQPTYELIERLAKTGAPENADTLIEDAIANTELDFHGLDLPEKDVARVIVMAGYLAGKKARLNILLTEIEELVARVDTTSGVITAVEPTVLTDARCPDCDADLGESSGECPECGWVASGSD